MTRLAGAKEARPRNLAAIAIPVFVGLALLAAVGFGGCAKILGDFSQGSSDAAGTGGSMSDGGPIRDSGGRDMNIPEAACSEGIVMCQGQNVVTCTNGALQVTSACPFACTAGSCVGSCKPNTQICQGSSLVTCQENGTYGPSAPCTSSVCVGGPGTDASARCAGTCVPGTTMCSGPRTLSTCNQNGEFQDTPCESVCSVSGPTASCTGTCVPDSRRCDGNRPQKCDGTGQWANDVECEVGICVDGSCAGTCVTNTKQCRGNTVQTCTGGVWVDDAACSFACISGACTTCAPGTATCLTSRNLETCTPDGGMSITQCPFVCAGNTCTGDCQPGAKRCVNVTGGLEQQFCGTDGTWMPNGVCSYTCANGDCTLCSQGMRQCSLVDNSPQICDPGGNWITNGSCPNGCMDGGICLSADGG